MRPRTVRTSLRAVAASACVVMAVVATTTDASAAKFERQGDGTTTTCRAFKLCIYEDTSFASTMYGYDVDTYAPSLNLGGGFSDPMNDQTSSIINNSSQSYCFYENSYYTGRKHIVGFGRLFPNLKEIGMNDIITSWHPGQCV